MGLSGATVADGIQTSFVLAGGGGGPLGAVVTPMTATQYDPW